MNLSVSSDGALINIYDHGVWVDKKNRRVQCNYCGKNLSGLQRLRRHLGGVAIDGVPCEQVPESVRESFRKMVLAGSRGPNADLTARNVQIGTGHKHGRNNDSFVSRHCSSKKVSAGQINPKIKSPNFQDLKGWIHEEEELKGVQDYVRMIKDSWAVTGCSILLDAWVDQKGHEVVAFVADCPAGPLYLKAFDVSDIINNTTALMSLIDTLVKEVGVQNVIQIVASSSLGWVGKLGEIFAGSHEVIFWSVSVSHCFELMLDQIWNMDDIRDILDKVTNISEFINNNPLVSKLLRDNSNGNEMCVSSEFELVTPYLTLESILKAKNNLTAMFSSYAWKNTTWDSREESKAICRLVNDSCFWKAAEKVVKCTNPLIQALHWFSIPNNEHIGYIYDTMDDIKEWIAMELDHKKSCYTPLWDVIDDVWCKQLHSPLHAAAYFLNPTSFYAIGFHLDQEVATGLLCSLLHISKESHIQAKIATQLDMYRLGIDCFNEASHADRIAGISPAGWWSEYGRQYPELQSSAIKILSQTCEGASRYKLKRDLAEKVVTIGMSPGEQQNLEELAFVHYNLHLQSQTKKGQASASASASDRVV